MNILITTSRSILSLNTESRIIHNLDQGRGTYYGIAHQGNRLYVAARNQMVSDTSTMEEQRGEILLFDNEMHHCGSLCAPFPMRDLHSIAWHDGRLWAVCSYDNLIAIFDGTVWESWYPLGQNSAPPRDKNHFNSFMFEDDKVWILAHNVGPSELLAFSLSTRSLLERLPLGQFGHNIWRENGQLFTCSSMDGRVLGNQGFNLHTGGFPRGVVFDSQTRCLGISELAERKDRDFTTGKILIYSRDWALQDEIALHGEGLILDLHVLPDSFSPMPGRGQESEHLAPASGTSFYQTFEEQFRGSHDLVTSRLNVYLPFIEPVRALCESPSAVDLGCGRGEWLELLEGNGFRATGVDLDEAFCLFCRQNKLNAIRTDALSYLEGLPPGSQCVVSAIHVAEHLPFETLQAIIKQAFRVLRSGGLLIMESPNPENLIVGTSSFYLDPTHQRPLPAMLLQYSVEFSGFHRVKTLYLNGLSYLDTTTPVSLLDVLEGVSPDYAVVAQKRGTQDEMALFDIPFSRTYGNSLRSMVNRYDQQTLARHTQAMELVRQAEIKATKAQIYAEELDAEIKTTPEPPTVLVSPSWWARLAKRSATLPASNTKPVMQTRPVGSTERALDIPPPLSGDMLPWHFLFSVLIEADARADFASRYAETLESLKKQTYRNFEVILLGAGIVGAGRDRLLKSEFVTFRGGFVEPALKTADLLNHRTAQARVRGEYILLLSGGITLEPDALARMNDSLNEETSAGPVDLLLCDYDRRSEASQSFIPFFTPGWDPDFITTVDYIGASFMTSRALLERNLPQSARYNSLYDWLKNLAAPGITFQTGHITDVLFHLPPLQEGSRAAASQSRGPEFKLPAPPPGLAVIIPNKDQPELLAQCLAFSGFQTAIPLEIIIVDNSSTDSRTLAMYREIQETKRAKVVRVPGSFNFSRMVNEGVAAVTSSTVIMLLNNDAEITQPGLLEELMAHALRTEVGVVGSKLLYSDGRVQHAGVLLGTSSRAKPCIARHVMRGALRNAPGYLGCLNNIRNYQAVTGALMLFRRDVFNQVGGFDEIHLPIEYNDIDFCLRVREAGLRVICLPLDGIFHKECMSRQKNETSSTIGMRSQAKTFMEARWPRQFLHDPYNNPSVSLGDCATEVFARHTGRPGPESRQS